MSGEALQDNQTPLVASPGRAAELARRLELGPVEEHPAGGALLAAAAGGRAGALVAGEELPDLSGLELARRLRASWLGSTLPLILVTENYSEAGEEAALAAGADEYVDAAQLHPRLLRRLRARLEQAWRRQDTSPLTGLPGRRRLEEELAARLPQRGRLALVALDLRHFKAFNDCYGYERGDRMLLLVREALLEALREAGVPEDLPVHLGGDDFFLVTEPKRAGDLVARVREVFDRRAPDLYDESDRAAGGLRTRSRAGEERFVPPAWLLAVGVTNRAPDLVHPGQFARIVAELKEYARAAENKELVWDRRLTHQAGRVPESRPAAAQGKRGQHGRDDPHR